MADRGLCPLSPSCAALGWHSGTRGSGSSRGPCGEQARGPHLLSNPGPQQPRPLPSLGWPAPSSPVPVLGRTDSDGPRTSPLRRWGGRQRVLGTRRIQTAGTQLVLSLEETAQSLQQGPSRASLIGPGSAGPPSPSSWARRQGQLSRWGTVPAPTMGMGERTATPGV